MGGTVFKITPKGAFTTLHSFGFTDGYNPYAGLVQASDGNFYGTTSTSENGSFFGTVFRITAAGVLTTMHYFSGIEGSRPDASLIQASDGNLYGTTNEGGNYNRGTIFRITLSGSLTRVHDFSPPGGTNPDGGLVQGADGNLYGGTISGGVNTNFGVVYSLTLGPTLF